MWVLNSMYDTAQMGFIYQPDCTLGVNCDAAHTAGIAAYAQNLATTLINAQAAFGCVYVCVCARVRCVSVIGVLFGGDGVAIPILSVGTAACWCLFAIDFVCLCVCHIASVCVCVYAMKMCVPVTVCLSLCECSVCTR